MAELVVRLRRPPELSPGVISDIILRHFPFRNVNQTSLLQLVSYEDRNYYFVGTLEGRSTTDEFVFKICNASLCLGLIEGQNAVMNHLKKRGIPCSYPLASRQSEYSIVVSSSDLQFISESCFCIRVFPYLQGNLLNSVKVTEQLLRCVGRFVGTMDYATESFTHPAIEARLYHWDLRNFCDARKYLYAVDDLNKIAMATTVFEYFSEHIEPVIPSLRHRIIHGDCNEQNILLRGIQEGGPYEVSGILDFGDCVYSCLVFNLAILLTYIMLLLVDDDDPLRYATPVIHAYQEVLPLETSELQLLYYCVLVRICLSVLIGAHSYRQDPSNIYLLCTQKCGWKLLKILLHTPKDEVDRLWYKEGYHVTTQ